MKFQILQENLEKAVNITSRFASTRAQLPILGNLLISTQKSKVHILSTNLEISASVQVGAKIEEEGEISIPARVISELIGNLPKETITLSSEKEQLKITSPGFSSVILGINPSDFPKVPNSLDTKNSFSLAQDELTKALSQVLFATSTDETRPVLTGVLFTFNKNSLYIVATDGFRLSRKIVKMETGLKEKMDVVIPRTVLGELLRLGAEDEALYFALHEKEKQVIFRAGDTILSSRLLEGEYPDYEKIIPKTVTTKILLDKEEFLRAIKLASIFARESANIVKIRVLGDLIKVSAESSSAGNQETSVEAKVESSEKDFEIAFNYRFIEEFLHSVVGEEVGVEFSGVSSPGVFTDTSDSSYLHLIMPVKIQG